MSTRRQFARATQLALLAADAGRDIACYRDWPIVFVSGCLAAIASRVIGPASRHQRDIFENRRFLLFKKEESSGLRGFQ